MKRTTSVTGRATADLIDAGLEVNAEIALEEPECPQGVDEDVLRVVRKHGLKDVLVAISAAAWGAAEVHEDMDPEDVELLTSVLRLRVFGNRLGEAIDALK